MLNHPTPEPNSGLRNFLFLSAAVVFIGGSYVGWVFYSRWEANQALDEKAAEKARAQASKTFEAMGGNRFEILAYSANPANVQAGERSSLCYSVSNAKSVEIDPQPDEPVWPAFSRCVNVTPRKTTKYRLTIGDGAGHAKSAIIEVHVR